MKKIQNTKMILFLLLVLAFLLLVAIGKTSAQTAQAISLTQTDKIIFLNGDIKEGKVIAFAGEKITFNHCNETLNYEFNKKEIEKIEFGSGRTEVINNKIAIPEINTKNRVAVVPLVYAGSGNTERSDYMRTYLQQMIIEYLSKSAVELKYIDAAEINATLLKAGITEDKMQQYTAKELAAMLQVEYIVTGSVLQTNKKQIKQTNKTTDKKGNDKHSSHETEITMQDIETEVSLSIYNEEGSKIYSKSRQSILAEADAYKNAIKYLLKRTPLHKM